MALLELRSINKYYRLKDNDKFHVLNNINLSFNAGELVSIIGESGSGKSTLMNLIGGLDSDFSGELLVNEKDIKKLRRKELDKYRKNEVGFIFQSFNLIGHLSVLDNVTIAMTLSNVRKKKRLKRAKEILRDLGLENHINKKPSQLSGGQKQRVAIARALINNPKIIIADEPTGSLDSKTTIQVLEIMKDISRKGKLVIMVTHSERVASASSRIIKISDGEIIDDNKVIELDNEVNIEKQDNIRKQKQNLSLISSAKLALVNMKEKLPRNILVSVGGSIGIMSIILMLSLGNGVKSYFNKTMNNYVNPLVIEVNMPSEEDENINLDVTTVQKPDVNATKPFEESDIDTLSKIENVSSVERGYSIISLGANSLVYNNKTNNLMNVSTISSNITTSNVETGTLPKAGEVLINKALSDNLGKDIIGQKVNLRILANQKILNRDFIVSGVYTTTSGDLTANMKSAFLNYADLEKLYSDNGYKLKPNVIYVNTTNSKYTSQIKQKVNELGYSQSSQEQMASMFNQMIDILTYVLSGIAAISLIVSAIMIIVVMYISVVERTKEIGIIKAIGARAKDIRRIFVSEAFLIGFFSGAIGLVGAYLIMRGINLMSNKLFGVSVVLIKREYAILGVIVSIVISTLAGLLPANKAARLDPVESLRRE
ncbi:ABC-type lipoprotein export system ATPase subunit/ABC-type antimicrobial peptide transport system permease subunit [Clostridium beijerinckii]|jgi:ABC-type antimicrobial peptide transport system, ATPase component|uniref:ATP-binding cassette domain-containing protein n=2 Tax=Clostridium beijerinckii TaxID=1520 RepID=A0AAE2RN97_CLOBE|nr:ABC transporter ATP-binding protein/permease [Clostridium beijerinckii]ABR36836.1 ABC transporter related [Clostridium beijerinckii NCIMB 8052]AIU01599.1 ABC transporter related protein [Clostridium beijerinckii ATCC 35702]MBF7808517.1 ATP-binding cassette domain-containing protein [Clostridium beijerinckii]NRT22089.1 ABC-type lipoprotein export system ATPase subunit/ABC-type antimicrobial peptide transport system permease subunit [Clostridium beijerinckii]NRT83082.1 ABC-type lipoprotein ex